MSAAMRWHASPTRDGQAMNIGAEDGANIATVWGPKYGGAESFREVAQKIAAAPEMYEALKCLMDWVDGWCPDFIYDDEWPEAKRRYLAAIAKAEGRS